MRIWIDADACPVAIRNVVFRAAERVQVHTTLVANQLIRLPPSRWVRAVQVESGFDVADDYIAARVEAGDLVVTGDIPLAAQVVEAGAVALEARGTFYTRENIREALAMRDFMAELRDTGQVSGGPAALSKTDVQAFANGLDRFLARHRASTGKGAS
ncbi:YaiI/YqxD family protein [Nitrogeniibacter mangrovi]|uniref:UPF0178 protein G3580_19570 n=1 Tax=Nitrogeniibacter mangrovi TaxID=2016596 RepID=A0A6C1B7D2_9RHOO|nr:YaiI/YqxD family protein [Nitrogeniibacter mangrovi]QID19621.1 YaiI/YqxD family protein [Nitrogeniibacter mangrovi]